MSGNKNMRRAVRKARTPHPEFTGHGIRIGDRVYALHHKTFRQVIAEGGPWPCPPSGRDYIRLTSHDVAILPGGKLAAITAAGLIPIPAPGETFPAAQHVDRAAVDDLFKSGFDAAGLTIDRSHE